MASPEFARAHGLHPRGRIVIDAVAGSEPVIMLTAPGPASTKCLGRASMAVADIDLWEINEAFAAVPLQTMRTLDLDPAKVNVNGGAIALGHPIGATGSMLIQTALDELERRDLSRRSSRCARAAAWAPPPSSNVFDRTKRAEGERWSSCCQV